MLQNLCIVQLEDAETGRTMMKETEGGYAADWSIETGGKAIVPDVTTGDALVASGAWSWVQRPRVEPETGAAPAAAEIRA